MHLAIARIASVVTAAALGVAGPVAADEPGLELAVAAQLWPAPAALRLNSDSGNAALVDYRLWLGGGRTSLGFGISTAALPMRGAEPGPRLQAGESASMIVGMRYRLSERSRLYVDSASDGLLPERDLRMGFEFKPRASTLGSLRGSLLRVQWSSRSQLSVRVRGGGLTFAYRSQFY